MKRKLRIKLPKILSIKQISNFFKLKELIQKKNKSKTIKILPPNLSKLYVLYQLIRLNNRISILELGSGWSSLFLSDALNHNKISNKQKLYNFGFSKPYEFISIDNSKKYLNISRTRLKKHKKFKIINRWVLSKVETSLYNNKICTFYRDLPSCQPDFIYLDGPDLFNINKNKRFKFSTDHPNSLAMSGDILRIEFFLLPGTILAVDGRGGNVEFLRKNFKRKWQYKYLKYTDQHIFLLDEKPIGKKNINLLKFYNS